MESEFLEVLLTVTRGSGKQECLELKKEESPAGKERWTGNSETVRAEFDVDGGENLLTARVRISLKAEAFRENDALCAREPVRILLRPGRQPRRMTAMYLHRDWWTRPAFIGSWQEMPDRTQCIYLDYGAYYGCLFLMAGKRFKTLARGGSGEYLTLEMTAYRGGQMELEEPVFVMAREASALGAVERACEGAAVLAGCPSRRGKEYPELFSWLGWCSWDAFYKEISERKVCAKAKELQEKQVPVRWLLLDDGWLSEKEDRLYDMKPESTKFPNGFSDMTARLKEGGQILEIGVWHALGGYWGGIEPGSRAWQEQRDVLYETVAGRLLPSPEVGKGYAFYARWYEDLRARGIGFVKVDGQSAVKNYFHDDIDVCRAAGNLHRALEGAAGCYMGGNLINCMGMAMENLLGRPGSAISRNSDDFVPDVPEGFAEHLVQNLYNAPYHSYFYYCDWDMFWTGHGDAEKHAVLRAVSGGPVYCSDRLGETAPEILRPLAYRDGRILRMERPALPSPDSLFLDPRSDGVAKVANLGDCGIPGRKAGAVAVFNLSGRRQRFRICRWDVYGLPADRYCCYEWRRGVFHREGTEFELEEDGYGVYLLLPLFGDAARTDAHAGESRGTPGFYTAVAGLAKYMGMLALESIRPLESGFLACVHESGSFVFCTDREVAGLTVNGRDMLKEMKRRGCCCRIDVQQPGQMIVHVEYA